MAEKKDTYFKLNLDQVDEILSEFGMTVQQAKNVGAGVRRAGRGGEGPQGARRDARRPLRRPLPRVSGAILHYL